MPAIDRYALYYLPPDGPLAIFGAHWLGWDVAKGRPAPQPDVPGIATATATPRRYGFHATLKPPFRLAEGQTPDALHATLETLAATQGPVTLDGLRLARLGSFLALVPTGDTTALDAFAARCVAEPDRFRAPQSDADLARRRAKGLTQTQETNLQRWGYPFVMQDFRFHMTLSGSLDPASHDALETGAQAHLPNLPTPFIIDSLALTGQHADGHFRLIRRYRLTGP